MSTRGRLLIAIGILLFALGLLWLLASDAILDWLMPSRQDRSIESVPSIIENYKWILDICAIAVELTSIGIGITGIRMESRRHREMSRS